ncbi:hypothetical protein ES707_21558 [subsurface metagenome]
MLRKIFESIRLYFRLYGFKDGVKFAYGLFRCSTESIYSLDLSKQGANDAIINQKLDVRFIDSTELFDAISSDFSAAKGRLLASLDRGRVVSGKEFLAVAYDEGKLAGWGWVRRGPLRYGNCRLSQKECVIHKCRTIRCRRRRGVYVTLLVNLQNALADRGIRRAYIGAKSFNKVSLRGIEKAGFEFVEECNLGSFASRLLHHLKGKGPKVMRTGE